jgi:hypothetical protein
VSDPAKLFSSRHHAIDIGSRTTRSRLCAATVEMFPARLPFLTAMQHGERCVHRHVQSAPPAATCAPVGSLTASQPAAAAGDERRPIRAPLRARGQTHRPGLWSVVSSPLRARHRLQVQRSTWRGCGATRLGEDAEE